MTTVNNYHQYTYQLVTPTAVPPEMADLHFAYKRLMAELSDLMESDDFGIFACPEDVDNMLCWEGSITGRRGTVSEGTEYKISFSFPDNYPFKPPKVKLETACFHPNVDVHGNICLDILQDKWSPAYDVRSILLSIQSLLDDNHHLDADKPVTASAIVSSKHILPAAESVDMQSADERLKSELIALMESDDSRIFAFPEDVDNMLCWKGTITGRRGTVSEGTEYRISLSFPDNYPLKPPKVKLETACFHPNVDVHGNICLDILQDKWSPIYDVRSILLSIQSLLEDNHHLDADKPVTAMAIASSKQILPAAESINMQSADERLKSELTALMESDDSGIFACAEDVNNMLCWKGTITGRRGTVSEGIEYGISLSFPDNYPFKPPKVKLETACFHPNVDVHGSICLDILQDKWSPAYDVRSILLSVQSLLEDNHYPGTDMPVTATAIASSKQTLPMSESIDMQSADERLKSELKALMGKYDVRSILLCIEGLLDEPNTEPNTNMDSQAVPVWGTEEGN